MALEYLIAGVALVALALYALLGGADFGGGVWNLLATGPRAEEHRRAISGAMGPVWEANHVWLIFLIVVLFICFPTAYAALSIAFFIPFHLVLIGIVLRGSAFVFRAHGAAATRPETHWSRVFGIASSVTPFLLGMSLAAISSGHLRTEGSRVLTDPAAAWLSPFAWALGAFALSICAYVAAIYLTLETEGEVREDFRRRALGSGAVMTALGVATLAVAAFDAPAFLRGMTGPASLAVFIGAGLLAALSCGAIYLRRFRPGRLASGGLVILFVLGWALAQQPYLIRPDLPLSTAAAPDATLAFVLWSLVPGGLLLIPSLALLFRVFKGANPAA